MSTGREDLGAQHLDPAPTGHGSDGSRRPDRSDDGLHRGLEVVGGLIVVVMVVSVLLQGRIAESISCGMLSAVGDVIAPEDAEGCDRPVAVAAAATRPEPNRMRSNASSPTPRAATETQRESRDLGPEAAAAAVDASEDHVHDLVGESIFQPRPRVADSRYAPLPLQVEPGQLDGRDLLDGRQYVPGQRDRLVVGLSDTVYTRVEQGYIQLGEGDEVPFAVPVDPRDVYEDGEARAFGGDTITKEVNADYATLLASLPEVLGPEAAATFEECRYPTVIVGNSESTSTGAFARSGFIFLQRQADRETRYAVLAHELAHAMYICAGHTGRLTTDGVSQGGGVNEAQAYYFGNLAAWARNKKPFSPNYGSYSFCETTEPDQVHRLGRPVTGVFIDLERQLDLQVGAGETQRRMGVFYAQVLLGDSLESFEDLRTAMFEAGPAQGITETMIDEAFTSLDYDTLVAGTCDEGFGPRGLLRPQPLD